ncbi:MAG: TraR/DksA family transcriptional regulator [Patescibacteria group bacterium]
MNQSKIDELKERLLEEKMETERELSTFAEKDKKVDGNWDSKFPQFGDTTSEQDENEDEVEEYLVELPLERVLEAKIKDINEALKKIERGVYGRCSECGDDIPLERLTVNPEAKTCIEHAE